MVTAALPDHIAILRILDANLDRTREGLRVVEDWCRFGANNEIQAAKCKAMRQTIAQWHDDTIRMARDTPNDVGTQLSHPQEETRGNIQHILRANFCRVEEALRAIEEYAKLYKPELAIAAKQMRYEVYGLDSALFTSPLQSHLSRVQLYLVTAPHDNLLGVVEAALEGGVQIVQYRDKDTPDNIRLANAQALKQLCDRYGVPFLVNDRVDIALAVDADGVHLGQTDLPIATARQLLGPEKIVGRSTTNPEELAKAIAEGADYVGVGPVYETPTKPGKAAAGHSYVAHAQAHCPVPWFAIGSINLENVQAVLTAGATRIAVVRAIMAAADPRTAAQQFLEPLRELPSPQKESANP